MDGEEQKAESFLRGVPKLEVKADMPQRRGWWISGEVKEGTGGQMEKWILWAESKSENNGITVCEMPLNCFKNKEIALAIKQNQPISQRKYVAENA